MTKGKYAARAANRMARTDNELLQAEILKVAERDGRIAELERELSEVRSSINSQVIAKADILSGKQVDIANAAAQAARDRAEEKCRFAAHQLVDVWSELVERLGRDVKIIPLDFADILGKLVPVNEVGPLAIKLTGVVNNRDTRRLTPSGARARNSVFDQAQGKGFDLLKDGKGKRSRSKRGDDVQEAETE